MVLSPKAPFRCVKARAGARFSLSCCFFIGKFAGGAGAETVAQAKIIVNLQTLITTRHALLLAFSSCFARPLFSRFSFFPEISGKWGRINLPKLTTFDHDSRPRRELSWKSRLVECPCKPHSDAVAYEIFPAVTHGPYGATTENRSGGRRRRGCRFGAASEAL